MLQKSARLTKREFDQYFTSGKRYHSDHLQVLYSPASEFHGAVVVGKKISKRAVDRNRWRRRVYNILYALQKQSELTGVFIVLTKPGMTQLTFTELKAEVLEIVGRITK